ncbi:hypothetical protein ACFU51_28410 [Streptomyces sp. NPDC057430]|uniref:hypothetical protein n=1 Tax=Streptomyces sp. NPDC057430 TaxID=3346131 RepID=UPI0036C13330
MARTPTRRKPAARKKAARTPNRSAVPAVAAEPATTVVDAAPAEADRLLATAETAHGQARQLRATAARQATAHRIGAARQAQQIEKDAAVEARRVLAAASRRADSVAQDAQERGALLLRNARTAAEQLTADAEADAHRIRTSADEHQAEAEKEAAELIATAEDQAVRLNEKASATAEQLRSRAADEAEAIRSEARKDADALVEAAKERAGRLLASAEHARETASGEAAAVTAAAKKDADRERADARRDAEELKSAAQTVLDDAHRQAATLAEEAQRTRRLASEDARRLQQTTAEDARRLTAGARAEADRVLAQARTEATAVRTRAEELLTEAKEKDRKAAEAQSTAEELLNGASEAMRRATSKTEQRLERRLLKGEARDRRRAAREERKAQARDRRQSRKLARPSFSARVAGFVKANARRVMVAGPILAPMAVAWTGQAGFAGDILGWVFPFTLLFAAAWELSTTFVGWMYHRARKAGDAGTLYRVSTWVFAGGAALMNFWHASGQVVGQTFDRATGRWVDQITYWHATPRAVSFAAMSIVGIVLWELYASLIHREHLRAENKVAKSRPRIGMIRWFRYPQHAWTAWSLTITDESLDTLERAWVAANRHRADAELVRRTSGLGRIRRLVARAIGVADWVPLRNLPPVPRTWPVVPVTGSRNPAEVPNFEVRLDRIPGTPAPRTAEPHLCTSALGTAAVHGEHEHLELEPSHGRTSQPLPPGAAGTANPQTGTPQDSGGTAGSGTGSEPENTPSGTSDSSAAGSVQVQEQVLQVLNLMDELGYDAVKLAVVQNRTGLPKTTAYHRLKDARAEWNRRSAS